MRRLSLLGSRVESRGALAGVDPHFFLGKGQRQYLVPLVATVKKVSAQQRQLLDADSIPSYQGEIGSHATFGPCPVRPYAVKGEYPESPIVSESGENKTHDCAPSKNFASRAAGSPDGFVVITAVPAGYRPAHTQEPDGPVASSGTLPHKLQRQNRPAAAA
jgi:hypothetical protein